MSHALDRALGALLSSLLLLSCDGPLRLVLVESSSASSSGAGPAGGSSGSGSAGTPSQSGTESGGSAGNGSGGSVDTGGEPPISEAGAGGADPTPWDAEPLYRASFSSHAFPQLFMQHSEELGFIADVAMGTLAERKAATFDMIPGAYDDTCETFRAIDVEAHFFRHAGSRIRLNPAPAEDAEPNVKALFRADATFCARPGMADANGVTFRASNYSDRVVHVRNGTELWIDDIVPDDAQFASESTFYREIPLSESE